VGDLQGIRVLGGREGRDLPRDEPDRVVEQDAGGLPPPSALDLSALRVACGGGDPGELERSRVRDGRVAAEVDHDHGAPRRQPVEVPLRGLPVHPGRLPQIHVEPAVGLLLSTAREERPESLEELLQVELAVVERRLRQREAAGQRVGVPVVDARHERAPAQVDHRGPRPHGCLGPAVRADIGDPVSADGDRLGDAVAGDGQNPSVAEDGVGGGAARERGRRAGQGGAGGDRGAVANEAPT
jgi:hypothetical protein